ncbi:hypothetical protein [Acidiphilium angustum]|uniref:hypothetical protein n=1 Tax=Acidiphilium angustum TaxID=523 RepID=UPI00068BE6CB|nr:hypothetical protein [Acidiphilium angustum]
MLLIPLTKIDVERRLVYGVAAEEAPDKAHEIMDYESAKPQFEKWSSEFVTATNGLSKGNLRVMHTKSVAGKFTEMAFDDASRRVEVCAHVVDPVEFEKCLQGVYTGFSIGGGYLKKWNDPSFPGVTRYTPDIREISLVDSPCMGGARFAEIVKADGLVEQIELVGHVPTFSEMWKSAPPVQTFAQAWAARPMTFAEMHKRGI